MMRNNERTIILIAGTSNDGKPLSLVEKVEDHDPSHGSWSWVRILALPKNT
jgi:hypothetical protein